MELTLAEEARKFDTAEEFIASETQKELVNFFEPLLETEKTKSALDAFNIVSAKLPNIEDFFKHIQVNIDTDAKLGGFSRKHGESVQGIIDSISKSQLTDFFNKAKENE